MSPPLLTFHDVSYAPTGVAATLSGLSFAVSHGEFFACLGADGAARNALAMLAAGLIRPTGGLVEFGATGRPPVPGTEAGLVFSAPGQGLIGATVREEVAVGPTWLGLPESEIAGRVESVLRRLYLWDLGEQSPTTLSGGEKQRLALAAALAMEPACLILDEPTAMLDPRGAAQVRQAARETASSGRGVLWLTGDSAEALAADWVLILCGGLIVWSGQPADLANKEESLVEWGLRPLPLAALRRALIERGLPLVGKPIAPPELVEELCSIWTR